MTDDLKSRLRKLEGGDKYGSTVWCRNPDGPEAADRIEALERMYREAVIQKELIFKHQYDRIEQLEAALRRIAQHDMQAIAIDALHPNERIRPALDAK